MRRPRTWPSQVTRTHKLTRYIYNNGSLYRLADHVLSFLIPLVILVHLLVAPYSKVEESFNLQAIHDILRYGVPYPWSPEAAAVLKAEYDHFNFPGAVPRSFVGAVVIAGLSEPFIALTRGLVNEQVIGASHLFTTHFLLLLNGSHHSERRVRDVEFAGSHVLCKSS